MTAKSEVRVDGEFLSARGMVGDLKWSSRWGDGPSGCDLASWTWDVSENASLSGVTRGSTVEIVRFGKRRWIGSITEPVRGRPWTINAEGWSRMAGTRPALDNLGDPTTVPAVGVENAGLPWFDASTPFSATAYGTVTAGQVNYLDALLNDWAKNNSLRWGVGPSGYSFAQADPTAPSWVLNATDLDIGVTDDRRYDRVVARYISAMSGDPLEATDWDTVSVGAATGRTFIMDLTGINQALLQSEAEAYAQAQLDQFGIPAWNSRISVTRNNLTTPEGIPADLADVYAGQMVHLHGLPLTLGRSRYRMATEVVLGEVEWIDGAEEITLAPLNLAVRTIVDEVAARYAPREMVA